MDNFDAAEVAEGMHELYEPLADASDVKLSVKNTAGSFSGNRELTRQAH